MEITSVLIKPLMTEKVTYIKENHEQVAFKVHPMANKMEVKQAVEEAFDVTVAAVNIVRRSPRNRKRQGRVIGRKPGWKKAYITLSQGDTIEFFEGV